MPFIYFVIILFLLENLLFLMNHNINHPILGMKLNGLLVSNLTQKDVINLIKDKFEPRNPLLFKYANKNFEVKREDVGADIDYQGSIDQLFGDGRNSNVFTNIITQNAALLGLHTNQVKNHVSKELLLIKVLSIEDEINQEPQPPMPDFTGDISHIIPAKSGIKVDTARLSSIILNTIFKPPATIITIPTIRITKSYNNVSNLDQLRKQATDYISRPIVLIGNGIYLTLTSSDLRSLLTVIEKINPSHPKETILALSLDSKKLNQKLDSFAKQLETDTKAEFNEYYVRSLIYNQFYSNTRKLAVIPTNPIEQTRVLGATTTSEPKTVYLTFDDGPNMVYQPMLLDILKAKGVHATFYFVGANSQLYKTVTQRTINEGHVIGDHTLTHALLSKLPPQKIFGEIKSAKDILNSFLAPKKITLFRPPYGGTNTFVWQDAKDMGLKTAFWSVDPRDWTEPSTGELVKRVVDNIKDGDLVLLHSNHFATVKALPAIIDQLSRKGFQFAVQQ